MYFLCLTKSKYLFSIYAFAGQNVKSPSFRFVSYFRLNKEAFKYVLPTISPKLKDATKKSAISKDVKLTATLRILAEGCYQKGAGNDINVNLCQSSVSDAFHECIDAMYSELCPRWISFVTEEEKYEIKKHFFRKTGFPGVIGCIDGTHVAIIPPSVEQRFKYLNRKGFYSLNVMVVCIKNIFLLVVKFILIFINFMKKVCDHKLRIRYIQSHSPGSCHDSLIWNVSDLKHHLKEQYQNGERNTWLLGKYYCIIIAHLLYFLYVQSKFLLISIFR